MANSQSSTSKRKIPWRKILVALGAIPGLICLFYVIQLAWALKNSDPLSSDTYQAVPTDTYELAAIEGNADIKIPARATEIHAYTTGFRDIDINVRFTIAVGELAGFMESSLCVEALQEVSPEHYGKSELSPSWWEPALAKHLEMCEIEKEFSATQHTFQRILVDMTNPDAYIVYVEVMNY
jgi:hypothetical protein